MSLVAIVGRPNVGKSTLFNRLVGRRVAIVEDWAGVTRDRNYAETDMDGCLVTLVDTGGLDPEADDPLIGSMAGQVEQAVDEADLILFVVDVQEGLLAPDIEIANYLRRRTKDVLIVVNKVDGEKQETSATEFYSLGFETLHSVSAEHRRGIGDLIDDIVERMSSLAEEEGIEDDAVRVAVLGRPNVGKSSLVNNLLGADRVVVSPIAGTTRDAIDTRVVVEDTPYLLIDTAGIRRKSKVELGVEKWSVMKAIRSIDRAQVCLVLVDAQEGLTDQDLRVLDLIFRGGRGAIICLNKWDMVEKDGRTFDEIKKDIIYRLGPHRHVPIISMSALTGQRVRKVFERVNQVVEEGEKRVSTSKLNDFLADALRTLTPPVIGRKKTRLYYVTQVRSAPPVFVFFCSYPDGIPVNYERYLVNRLRAQFGFDGVPIRIIFRQRRRNADEEQ